MTIKVIDAWEFDKLTEWCRNKPDEAAALIMHGRESERHLCALVGEYKTHCDQRGRSNPVYLTPDTREPQANFVFISVPALDDAASHLGVKLGKVAR